MSKIKSLIKFGNLEESFVKLKKINKNWEFLSKCFKN